MSNYSIGLQHLKPVHTAYCGLHNLAENWFWARDVNGRDRDETETLTIFLETETSRLKPCNVTECTDKPTQRFAFCESFVHRSV